MPQAKKNNPTDNPVMDFDRDIARFTPRQLEACAAIDSGYKYILYGGALGGGKLLRLSTPLATPKGWTTMGEIRVGGQVFDEAGNVCNVIAVSKEQTDKTFSIVFSDGAEIIAGASHEWVTETAKDRDKITRRTDKYRAARRAKRGQRGTGRRPDLARRNASQIYKYLPPVVPTIKTTQEIHDTLMAGREKNHSIPVCGPLSLPIADLPIPPYVLGAWLGDGCSTSGQIAGIDNQIMAEIRACGYEVRDHSKASSHGIIGLKKQLQEIGVYANKHIPLIYLRAAIPQRLALLQGLMDTDGHCDARGQCEIQVVSKPLADGIRELICSLGIKVKMCTGRAMLYGRECGEKYRLKFITGLPAFRLRRKIERQKRTDFRGTHQRRYIISVTEIAAEPMKCIQVDSPSAMYLCGKDMIPTHNSYLLRWIAVRILMFIYAKFKIKGSAVMLACEDYPTLKDRQISKIAKEFSGWLGKYHDDHKIYGKCYILAPSYGSGVICLRNLDDPSKYQSAEFVAILVDELTKNDISVFTDLRMRLRWPGVPDEKCVFVGATNPGGIGHNYCKAYWVTKVYPPEFISPIDFRPKFKFIPSKAEDNPHLDEAYWATLHSLPEHLRAAFRDGSWDVFQGQAFTFMRETHVIPAMPIPKHAPIYSTFDWGFGAPFSWGWWWVDGDGRVYRFAEFYGWNGTPNQGLRWEDSRIADEIVKREAELAARYKIDFSRAIRKAGPDCFQKKPDYRGGGQGPSTAEVFASRGLYLSPGDATREVKIRQFRERLKVPLDDAGKPSGMPMMMVYENCDQFIRTIPDIVVHPNNPEYIDDKGEVHVFDEACHICMARPLSLRIPPRLKTDAQAHIDMITRSAQLDPLLAEEAEAEKTALREMYEADNDLIYTRGGTYSDLDGR